MAPSTKPKGKAKATSGSKPGRKPKSDGPRSTAYVDTRFKFKSAAKRTKEIQPSTSLLVSSRPTFPIASTSSFDPEADAASGSGGDDDPDDLAATPSLFSQALSRAALSDLSLPLQQLNRRVAKLSRSLPLLVHHREEVVEAVCRTLRLEVDGNGDDDRDEDKDGAEAEGGSRPSRSQAVRKLSAKQQRAEEVEKVEEGKRKAAKARERLDLVALSALSLLPALIDDLSTLLLEPLPSTSSAQPTENGETLFEKVLSTLVAFTTLPALDPKALETAYQVVAHAFKTLARELKGGSEEFEKVWNIVREGLGAPARERQEEGEADRTAAEGEAEDPTEVEEAPEETAAQSDAEAQPTQNEDGAVEVEVQPEDEDVPELPSLEEAEFQDAIPAQPLPTPSPPRPKSRPAPRTTPATRRLLASAVALLLRKARPSLVDADADGDTAMEAAKGLSDLDAFVSLIFSDLASVEHDERRHLDGELKERKETKLDRKGKKKGSATERGEEEGGARVFAEGVAYVVAEACKSVEHRVHSRASSIILSINTHLTSGASHNEPSTLPQETFHAALISTLHHTRAERFEPVLDRLVGVAEDAVSRAIDGDTAVMGKVEAMARVIAITTGVRKGSRISSTLKPRLFALLHSTLKLLGSTAEPQSPVSLFALSLLSIASLPDLLAHLQPLGVIDTFFSVLPAQTAAAVCRGLAEVGCGFGMKDHMVPRLLRILEGEAQQGGKEAQDAGRTLMFLAGKQALPAKASVADSEVFRGRLAELLATLGQALTENSPFKVETGALCECLDLLDTLNASSTDRLHLPSSLGTDLASMAAAFFTSSTNVDDWKAHFDSSGPNNWLIVVSRSMALSRQSRSGASVATAPTYVERILEEFSWNRELVAQAAEDAEAGIGLDATAWQRTVGHVKRISLSHDPLIRSSALRIALAASSALGQSATMEIVQQCLKVEVTPLTIEDARERGVHLRKLGVLSKTLPRSEESEAPLGLAISYLLGQLTVPFRPLWDDAIQALTSVASSFPNQIWDYTWSQVEATARLNDSHATESCATAPAWGEAPRKRHATDFGDSFRCTNLSKIEASLDEGWDAVRKASLIYEQQAPRPFDARTYEVQLLLLLRRNATLAERHNAPIVDAFFLRCQPGAAESDHGDLLGRSARTRLVDWLPLFAQFANPRALYRATEVRSAMEEILADADASLRRLALDCILAWKDPDLVKQAETLQGLLDPPKFRDSLLNLGLSMAAEDNDGAAEVSPAAKALSVRILFGAMLATQRRTSAVHGGLMRKGAILTALKGCAPADLNLLVDLMLRPLQSSSSSPNPRRRIGFLVLLADVLKQLGTAIVSRWAELLEVVLDFSQQAQQELDTNQSTASLDALKQIRAACVQRVVDLFANPADFDFSPWLPKIVSTLVDPRLDMLPSESSQAPSPLLSLFVLWAGQPRHSHLLLADDGRILTSVFATLSVPSVKPAVVQQILDVVDGLLTQRQDNRPSIDSVLPDFLARLAGYLRVNLSALALSSPLGRRLLGMLSGLATSITSLSDAQTLCDALLDALERKRRLLAESVQLDMLKAISELLRLGLPAKTADQAFEVVGPMLETAQSRAGRLALVDFLKAVTGPISDLSSCVELLVDLNSFSSKRIEEPDFDRRLEAYARAGEDMFADVPPLAWKLLLHQSFYQIKDEEELSLRSAASALIVAFLDLASQPLRGALAPLISKSLLPSLRRCLRSRSEIVRIEALQVLSATVERATSPSELSDMKCLLVDGDREANVFLNLYHLQTHRRTRAMRRLADNAVAGHLTSRTLLDILAPLLSPFILPSIKPVSAELTNEAVQCLGRIASVLNWSAYMALLNFYAATISRPHTLTKSTTRALVAILKHFHFNLDPSRSDGPATATAPPHAQTMVVSRLVPRLLRFMDQRSGAEEGLRIMVGEGLAVVAVHLPDHARQTVVTATVSSLAQIAKSLQQDVRIQARSALSAIASTLPQASLPDLIKELRGALARGPQLHVLAHIAFAIVSKLCDSPDALLESAIADAVGIFANDLLGAPSKERESREFRAKSKFQEVRSSRSLEGLQVVSAHVPPSGLVFLLAPFRSALEHTPSPRMLRAVDEGLRHVSSGVVANVHLAGHDLLGLIHAMISGRSSGGAAAGSSKTNSSDRLVAFGLDIFNNAFRKNRFDLHDPDTLGRIDPLVSFAGNALYSRDAEVVPRALRAMAVLIKLPLPSVEKSAPVIVRQMLAVVSNIGSSESDLSQSALRTLAIVVRDCKNAALTEKQLTTLLDLVEPDLEDPERQMTLFALLRAILTRKLVVAKIYDLMDRVAEMVVVSQSTHVQEVARSAYLQFLLDYPQGRGRLQTSMQFLARNLAYEHEAGRRSVLELLAAICTKFSTELVAKTSNVFFASLVMALANESSAKCREMAFSVYKRLLSRLDAATASSYADMLIAWSKAKTTPSLQQAALQFLGLMGEELGAGDPALLARILAAADTIVVESAEGQEELEHQADAELGGIGWELPYHALHCLMKTFRVDKDLVLSSDTVARWSAIRTLLLYPHDWVRANAARAIGLLFASGPTDSSDELGDEHPFSDAALFDTGKKSSLQLRDFSGDDAVSLQIVKNIVFVLKALRARGGAIEPTPFGPVAVTNGSTDEGELSGESDEEDESASDEDAGTPVQTKRSPVAALVHRLSLQARRAHDHRPSVYNSEARRWSVEPSSVLRSFAAFINQFDVADVEALIGDLLTPLYRISEDDNVKDPQMAELQTLAQECLELLKDKIGAAAFSRAYSDVRTVAVTKRQARKTAAAARAVSHPELDAKRRASRTQAKLRQRKRKQVSFAQQKLLHSGSEGARKKMRTA